MDTIKNILVPVDGSAHANKAIEFAVDMAIQSNATIHLLHVVEVSKVPKGINDYIRSEGIKDTPEVVFFENVGNQIMVPAQDKAKIRGSEHIETVLIQGDPASEIINYAEENDFDMIVMGRRGLENEKGPGLGSVASKVSNGVDMTCVMVKRSLLDGKKILIVDDEPDVLETLTELLPMCDVEKISTFEEAKKLLETQSFDMAILDIMGVDGYELLKIANQRDVIAVMLTAHALSPDNVIKSHKEGAASYVPKEKMGDITTFLNDILEAHEKGKNFWWRWLKRFGAYFNKVFGPDWQESEKEYWEKYRLYY